MDANKGTVQQKTDRSHSDLARSTWKELGTGENPGPSVPKRSTDGDVHSIRGHLDRLSVYHCDPKGKVETRAAGCSAQVFWFLFIYISHLVPYKTQILSTVL
jgi:hypothetical protein